jgi:hypothetical protein
VAFKFAKEVPAGLRIEHSFRSGHAQLSVPETDRPEEADALSGGRMTANWIGYFRWNPHAAARAVLLEVNFIESPQLDAWISSQSTEFFYA